MEITIISIAAFLVSVLTFFSGFGLGTILAPVMMLFFPIEIAIGLTGIVHFLNNIFKFFLVGKNANKEILIRFGIPAVIAAIVGSWILIDLKDLNPLFTYSIFTKVYDVYPIKFVISILILLFVIIEFIPFIKKLEFNKNKLIFGGILSGFFGGLAGIQGALRSAFLIKAGLTKEQFIATTVIISIFVDFTRLSMYSTKFLSSGFYDNKLLIFCATISAFTGAFLGNKLLKKVTINSIQIIVSIMLIVISILLGSGIV